MIFSSNQAVAGTRKDTVINAEQTGHFAWNLRDAVNISAEQVSYGVDEFGHLVAAHRLSNTDCAHPSYRHKLGVRNFRTTYIINQRSVSVGVLHPPQSMIRSVVGSRPRVACSGFIHSQACPLRYYQAHQAPNEADT